jgi:hypothetical protein
MPFYSTGTTWTWRNNHVPSLDNQPSLERDARHLVNLATHSGNGIAQKQQKIIYGVNEVATLH